MGGGSTAAWLRGGVQNEQVMPNDGLGVEMESFSPLNEMKSSSSSSSPSSSHEGKNGKKEKNEKNEKNENKEGGSVGAAVTAEVETDSDEGDNGNGSNKSTNNGNNGNSGNNNSGNRRRSSAQQLLDSMGITSIKADSDVDALPILTKEDNHKNDKFGKSPHSQTQTSTSTSSSQSECAGKAKSNSKAGSITGLGIRRSLESSSTMTGMNFRRGMATMFNSLMGTPTDPKRLRLDVIEKESQECQQRIIKVSL